MPRFLDAGEQFVRLNYNSLSHEHMVDVLSAYSKHFDPVRNAPLFELFEDEILLTKANLSLKHAVGLVQAFAYG